MVKNTNGSQFPRIRANLPFLPDPLGSTPLQAMGPVPLARARPRRQQDGLGGDLDLLQGGPGSAVING